MSTGWLRNFESCHGSPHTNINAHTHTQTSNGEFEFVLVKRDLTFFQLTKYN